MLARSATKPRRQNAGRPAEKSCRPFLQWLRGRPCACAGRNAGCSGRMEAAHVDYAGDKGVGTKVSDRHAIPLSQECHAQQHRKGWRWFDEHVLGGASRGLMLAQGYWSAWLRTPMGAAWEARNG